MTGVIGSLSWALRRAVDDDIPIIHDMILRLAIFEKEPKAVKVTIDDLVRDFKQGRFSAVILTVDKQAAGFALYFDSYSTWEGRSLYLEDLYIDEAYRGRGFGKRLMSFVASEALERGAVRMTWQALSWNHSAIDFYLGRKINAHFMDGWNTYRVNGVAKLQHIAQMSQST